MMQLYGIILCAADTFNVVRTYVFIVIFNIFLVSHMET